MGRRRRYATGLALFLLVLFQVVGVFATPREAPKVTSSRPESILGVSREVDQLLARGWKKNRLEPSAPASEPEFFRRLSLDLRGRIPSVAEIGAFLEDEADGRRGRWSDRWLDSEEHHDYYSRVFTEILLGTEVLPAVRPGVFRLWLREELTRGTPWNEIVSHLVTARHPRSWYGPTNFLLRWSKTPEEMAASTSRLLLGVQIECAQCHDHPGGSWTQEDFFGFAAYFARTQRVPINMRRLGLMDRFGELDFYLENDESLDVYVDPGKMSYGFTILPSQDAGEKKVLPPRFLGRDAVSETDGDRRAELARIVTQEDSLQLSRALVNRIYQMLFGRGLVHPVDDFGSHNPASHPQLLELLAKDFRDSGFHLRRLLKILTSTRAYALSSEANSSNRLDEAGFAKAPVRQLRPNQLFNSILAATGSLPSFEKGGGISAGEIASLYSRFESIVGEIQRELESRESGATSFQDRFGHCTESKYISPEERRKMIAAGFEFPVGIRDPTQRDPAENLRQSFLADVRSIKIDEDPMAGSVRGLQNMLLVMNGSLLNERITSSPTPGEGEGLSTRGLKISSAKEVVKLFYLSTLSRLPTDAELKVAVEVFSDKVDRADSLEDLLWALVNSAEFLTNH